MLTKSLVTGDTNIYVRSGRMAEWVPYMVRECKRTRVLSNTHMKAMTGRETKAGRALEACGLP